MLGSHALHISRRATSEADEQSIPLASSSGDHGTKPATLEGTRQKGKSRRFSLIAPAFARAIPDDVQLKAIAQVTEDRRRASVAIRRQSLIQSLHDDVGSYSSPKTYASGPRGSISALMSEPSTDDTIGALPPRRYSIAEQERRASLAGGWSSMRRGSQVQPGAAGGRRRSSLIDAVGAKTGQAVRRASLAILGERVSHYASLVVAEKPLEAHQSYRRRRSSIVSGRLPPDLEMGGQKYGAQADVIRMQTEDEWSTQDAAAWEQYRLTITRRWQGAAATLINSAAMVKDITTLSDRFNKPSDRFAAAAGLAMKLEGHLQKRAILDALERRRLGPLDAFFDNFLTELAVTGERLFEVFTPAQLGQHRLFFTCAWTFVIFSVFWYTIGEFPYYEMVQFPDPQRSTCLEAIFRTPMGYGSSQLVHWINNAVPWCYDGEAWLLGGDFLIVWGARWGPLMRAQPYRWFTSWFLHQSFTHVLSNMLLFLVIAIQMEEKYGCLRMVVLWLFSSLGGNFFSAAFEDTCLALVGASGGVFGMVGLFIADMVVNFASIRRPILRSIMMVAFLIYFIITVATTPTGTSHLSHVGGFVTGLFPAMMFLPHLKSQKFEAWIPVAGAIVTLIVFVALPTYFYTHKYPHLNNCGADVSRYY